MTFSRKSTPGYRHARSRITRSGVVTRMPSTVRISRPSKRRLSCTIRPERIVRFQRTQVSSIRSSRPPVIPYSAAAAWCEIAAATRPRAWRPAGHRASRGRSSRTEDAVVDRRPAGLDAMIDLAVRQPGIARVVDREDAVRRGGESIEVEVGIMRHGRSLPGPCDTSYWRDGGRTVMPRSRQFECLGAVTWGVGACRRRSVLRSSPITSAPDTITSPVARKRPRAMPTPDGRAREDDVARLQRADRREVRDQRRDREDQLTAARFLHALARDVAPQRDVVGVGERVDRHERGADRPEVREALAERRTAAARPSSARRGRRCPGRG